MSWNSYFYLVAKIIGLTQTESYFVWYANWSTDSDNCFRTYHHHHFRFFAGSVYQIFSNAILVFRWMGQTIYNLIGMMAYAYAFSSSYWLHQTFKIKHLKLKKHMVTEYEATVNASLAERWLDALLDTNLCVYWLTKRVLNSLHVYHLMTIIENYKWTPRFSVWLWMLLPFGVVFFLFGQMVLYEPMRLFLTEKWKEFW